MSEMISPKTNRILWYRLVTYKIPSAISRVFSTNLSWPLTVSSRHDAAAAFTREMTGILREKQSHPQIAQMMKPAEISDPPPANAAFIAPVAVMNPTPVSLCSFSKLLELTWGTHGLHDIGLLRPWLWNWVPPWWPPPGAANSVANLSIKDVRRWEEL